MSARDWDAHYATDDLPWDTGEPDPHLVALVEGGTLAPCRVLEVGCGTGTNALWLCERGFEVTGIDVASRAIAKAEQKARVAGTRVEFATVDFLHAQVPGGDYELVFDRGVFHVFDDASDQARFAERVASVLRPQGRWLSLAGSTEGPPRDHGPPRRSALDIAMAVEPSLELLELRSIEFAANLPSPAKAWLMLARRRTVPAQPSTIHDP
ncbi:class I SAM-dependent methyltransferase [Paraliomyxa miuraensis]|uniref:class I SAM-dependent methyltransferase n=1 Tax=Paraliomyxa miuraensis TaxID=376150 RepID=UPI00225BCF23|nr:class I SAM-dependent methyltransferase [Paraliomyxa miuraensis]MCX4243877.1 class I SAM-dependent methyltransferase [Paraliomyxa miuraensis]